MIREKIELKDWGWCVYAYYDVTANNGEEILLLMEMLGASRKEMSRAARNLRSDSLNNGFTFTSHEECASLMVVGKTTSAAEFANTFDHEKGHLVKHICIARGIDPYSEEAEYLAGDISKSLFPTARQFLCDTCRMKMRG